MPRPFLRLTTEAPLEVVPSAGGYHIRNAAKRDLWARITGLCGSGSESGLGSGSCSECAYAWEEVVETGSPCGVQALVTSGTQTSFPAYEINGDSTISVGTIVRLYPSRNGAWYVFQRPGDGGRGFEFAYIMDDSPEEIDDGVYYNATIPQWSDDTQDWEDPGDASPVWVRTRVNQPLSKGDILVVRLVGIFDPVGNDSRPVYAGIRTRCVDPITIQDSSPVDAFGNLYWPARVQYWDNNAQERKEGRECWVIDWLDELQAFRAGDHIVGYWIGESEPGTWVDNFTGFSGSGDGSGSGSDSEHSGPKPLYMTFCSGINTKFIKCFDNQTLARNGTIANIGTRVAFLDENCDEATDFEGICQPGE